MRKILFALMLAVVAIGTAACTGGGCSTCG